MVGPASVSKQMGRPELGRHRRARTVRPQIRVDADPEPHPGAFAAAGDLNEDAASWPARFFKSFGQ
jgi:hypothetical protein